MNMEHLLAATNKVVELNNQLTAVTEQRDALAGALRGLLISTPRFLSCEDFHHEKQDRMHGDKCPPTERFRDAWLIAEKALSDLKP